jgi:hypothetical protein
MADRFRFLGREQVSEGKGLWLTEGLNGQRIRKADQLIPMASARKPALLKSCYDFLWHIIFSFFYCRVIRLPIPSHTGQKLSNEKI